MTHLSLWSHSSKITTFMHKHYVSAEQTAAKNNWINIWFVCLWFLPNVSHLYLQQLLLVGGVHLLQGLLQFMVPVQEGFPQLCCQVEICPIRSKNVNTRYEAVSVAKRGEQIELHLCKGYLHTHRSLFVSRSSYLDLVNHKGIQGMPWDLLVTLLLLNSGSCPTTVLSGPLRSCEAWLTNCGLLKA